MQFESAVAMEMKVNHTGALASGHEQLVLAFADTITQVRGKANGLFSHLEWGCMFLLG